MTIVGSMYGAAPSQRDDSSSHIRPKPPVMPTPRTAATRQAVVSASTRSDPEAAPRSQAVVAMDAPVVTTA